METTRGIQQSFLPKALTQFGPAAILPPNLEAGLEDRQVGKLGLHLMRKLMDKVSYSFGPEEGNTLIMTKRLSEARL